MWFSHVYIKNVKEFHCEFQGEYIWRRLSPVAWMPVTRKIWIMFVFSPTISLPPYLLIGGGFVLIFLKCAIIWVVVTVWKGKKMVYEKGKKWYVSEMQALSKKALSLSRFLGMTIWLTNIITQMVIPVRSQCCWKCRGLLKIETLGELSFSYD